jgi:methyl-accepting chemotaxis protein
MFIRILQARTKSENAQPHELFGQNAADIAHAAKEQAEATNDITQNISEVAKRTSEISSNMTTAQLRHG